jgi:hypothetical protein
MKNAASTGAIILFLFLSGCLSVSVSNNTIENNAVVVPTLQLNASTNSSTNSSFSHLPDKEVFCVFGGENPLLSEALSGNLSVSNKTIPFETVFLSSENSYNEQVSNCAVIVLTGTDEGRFMSRTTRSAVASRLRNGANLIIDRDAATLIRKDSSFFGWKTNGDDSLEEFLPVKLDFEGNELGTFGTTLIENGSFIIRDSGGVLGGFKNSRISGWNVTRAIQEPFARVLVDLSTAQSVEEYQVSGSYLGLAVRDFGIFQKAYYFSYEPLNDPQILSAVARNAASGYLNYLRK